MHFSVDQQRSPAFPAADRAAFWEKRAEVVKILEKEFLGDPAHAARTRAEGNGACGRESSKKKN